MAITNTLVKKLQRITADLGDLLLTLHPVTIKEWDVFDGAVTAHKHLRKLDTDSLLQLELPFEKKHTKTPQPRKDCPLCKGSGSREDEDTPSGPFRPCSCREVEDVAWEKVKKEWAEELVPAEA